MSYIYIKGEIFMKSIFMMNGKELIDFMRMYIYTSDVFNSYDLDEKEVLIELYRDNNNYFLEKLVFPYIDIYSDIKKIFAVWLKLFINAYEWSYISQRLGDIVCDHMVNTAKNIVDIYLEYKYKNTYNDDSLYCDVIAYKIIPDAIYKSIQEDSRITTKDLSYIYDNKKKIIKEVIDKLTASDM
mgnify:CR=1 FL=1